MDKNFYKGIFVTLLFLMIFGMVTAIGFHTADEILAGTFSGSYAFSESLKIYSNEIGNTDRRLTINTNTADLITIYNYDEGDTNKYNLGFGGTSGYAIFVNGSNNNVGIGTTSPNAALDLGNGDINFGWEKVANNCGVTDSCVATCSLGKKIISGGCASGSVNEALRRNFPSSNSTWQCSSAGSSYTLIAYAICANIY